MVITDRERVGKALEFLKTGLGPFAEREFAHTYQAKAVSQLSQDNLRIRHHMLS